MRTVTEILASALFLLTLFGCAGFSEFETGSFILLDAMLIVLFNKAISLRDQH